MITLNHIDFSYPKSPVFQDFNLTLANNTAILGKSGCGKTTLLHLISGLLKPQSGSVLIDDKSNEACRSKMGIVMQKGGVFAYKTVYENMALGVLQDKSGREKVLAVAELLGLSDKLNQYPSQLSGGQAQRTALGRVLCTQPQILLLDEPFSALDELTRQQMQEEVLQIGEQFDMQIVTVTHSIEEAVRMGQRVLVLSEQGKLTQSYDVSTQHVRDLAFYRACIAIKKDIEGELI